MDSSLSFGEGWGEAFELLYILMRLPWQYLQGKCIKIIGIGV